nr:MAG TPA: hypothetical protein [Microviridae sp.]
MYIAQTPRWASSPEECYCLPNLGIIWNTQPEMSCLASYLQNHSKASSIDVTHNENTTLRPFLILAS